MWEFSVLLESRNRESAKYIYNTLKRRASEFSKMITCYEQSGFISIVLACEDFDRARLQYILSHCISNVICRDFKAHYLEEHLTLPLQDEIGITAFKKALLSFDKETDEYIVNKAIIFHDNLFLESFYMFRLQNLRDKWAELVGLANDNKAYLLSSDTFLELLKFLIDNLEIKEGEVNVVEDENGYHILNDLFENLDDEIANINMDKKEELVSALIELCPRRINMYCENDNSAINLLTKIFETRVTFKDNLLKKT